MIPRRARNHRCSRESLPPRQTELRRTSSGRPFVLSYQDAPSKPEVGGVTIVTLLVRWGPPEQAGSPTDWSPKVARKRKGGGPPGATRRQVLQTVGEPNPQNPARARFREGSQSVPRGRVLISYENAVPKSVLTYRMAEHRRSVHRRIADVIYQWPSGRVKASKVANPLGNFMIRAGRIAAHPQAPNYGTSETIKSHSATEGDDATHDLVLAASSAAGWR